MFYGSTRSNLSPELKDLYERSQNETVFYDDLNWQDKENIHRLMALKLLTYETDGGVLIIKDTQKGFWNRLFYSEKLVE